MVSRSRNAHKSSAGNGLVASRAAQLLQQAVGQHQQGRLDQASALYQELLRINPADHNALHLSGVIALQTGDFGRAIALTGQALAIHPDSAEINLNHGRALLEAGQPETAVARFEKAIALQPGMAEAWFRLGQAQRKLGRHEDAVSSYARLLAISPDHAPALCACGVALKSLGRWAEAVARFDQAIAIQPDYVFACAERAQALLEIDQPDAALASYEQALRHAPGHPEVSAQKALLLLLNGDFEKGWQLYESRWHCQSFAANRRGFAQPVWTGKESLAGKTILLHAEQGLGDTIQFCRYAALLARLAARVLLEVQPPLVELLASLEGVATVLGKGEPLPPFDFYCPLLSLPAAFRTTLENMPAAPAYLWAPEQKLASWRARLGPQQRPRVGLVWSGGTRHSNDHRRSLPLSALLPFLPDGYQYISLQKEIREADRVVLESHPEIQHFGDQLGGFGDTAAIATLADVVISVDTSVAHLSAALGVTTLLLLPYRPDWRWLMSGRDSPWYPSMQLCRQPADGDWTSVLSQLPGQLAQSLGGKWPADL